MRRDGFGKIQLLKLLVAGVLLRGCVYSLLAQTDSPPSPKRVRIDLGESPLEQIPLPSMSSEPLGAVASAPSAQLNGPAGDKPPNRKGEFIFAPIPVSSEAIGIGVASVAGYVFFPSKSDLVSPPSMLGLAGIFTSTKTYGLGFGGVFNLRQDHYRITFLAGAARVRYEFFGVGTGAGGAGKSIWLSQHGHAVFVQGLRRLKYRIFAGPRFSQREIKAGHEGSAKDLFPNLPQPPIHQLNLAITSAAAGFRVERDTRDDIFYPRYGSRLDARADIYGPYIGSTFTFQEYQFEANKYVSIGKQNVLAMRGMGCGVTGSQIPFFDLCQFGMSGDIRGYQAGRYRDRTMFAIQAEWRIILSRRFGAAVFGGVGEVAPGWGSYKLDDLLPAGGVGLRFNLSKQRRIHLRADVAYSKSGSSWSMGVAEAF